MKNRKLLFLAAISAISLTGCSILDILDHITGSDVSISDEEIPVDKGLYVYNSDGTEFGCDENNPTYSADGVELKKNENDTYDRVGATSYSNNLPSVGSPRILVIPVKLTDFSNVATDSVRNDIYKSFFGKPEETGWQSVSSFYYKSSFGKLNIQGAVTDWYNCGYSSTQIANLKSSVSGYDPTWTILENAVSWYKSAYDDKGISFDTNHDGFFDAVWLVYGAPNGSNNKRMDSNTFWAYTYFDTSVINNKTIAEVEKYKSNPVGYHYAWASYDFMYEGYGSKSRDAHTYIHETGHLLGLDDYYVATTSEDYPDNYGPVGWIDMMDGNVIDHNSFSKFALGWVNPYVPTSSCTIELKPASTSGEFVLLPTSGGWNGMAFDEYMVLEYYTPEGLNESDSNEAYSNGLQGMTNRGIRIYHVDARLANLNKAGTDINSYADAFDDDETVYVVNSNTAYYNYVNSKGTVGDISHRLIQLIDCASRKNYDTECDKTGQGLLCTNTSLFTAGKSFSYASYAKSFPAYWNDKKSLMNDGTTLPWSMTVKSITNEKAIIQISMA